MIRLAQPDLGEDELDAISRVFASGVLTDGPVTRAFEAAFAAEHEVAHAVAFASGTVALAGLYLGLGIGPGDDIVLPSMTFISTAAAALHVGARPVFADIHADTFDLDAEDVARRITPATKAIVAVHYGGQPADLDALRAVAEDAGVALVEDAAEAHGARYRGSPVGGFGSAAMFSFTPTKNMTMGEGGIVTTNDADLARRLQLLRNHGQAAPDHHVMVGYNWRLTEMQAAIGLVQLRKLPAILDRKQASAAKLAARLEGISGVTPPALRPEADHVFMLYTVLVERRRDEVRQALREAGIESRVYFPPAHLQPIFADASVSLPVTEAVAQEMLSVPMHAQLQAAELDLIADTIEAALA